MRQFIVGLSFLLFLFYIFNAEQLIQQQTPAIQVIGNWIDDVM